MVIGASVGAVEALLSILPKLPADYPFAVLVVVHVPAYRKSMLAEVFAAKCAIAVKEAEDKEEIRPSTVYFAPPDYHMLVEPDFTLALSSDEQVIYSRPSINVLFQSAADAYGDRLTGVILTGASRDGAAGLKAVCDAGGRGFVQNPDTAEGDIMPSEALKACPAASSLLLDEIASRLISLVPTP